MAGNVRSIRMGLFGDCGVGKSALAKVLAGGAFEELLPPTVFDTLKHSVTLCQGQKEVPMEFWDVSGSDRYAKKRPVIYPNVNAFAVCFDLNDRYSFNNGVKIWLAEVASACQGLPVFLVATKSDKGTAKITQSEIEFAMRTSAVATQARPFLYVETSAKNRKFIDDLFVKLVYCVMFDGSMLEQKKGPGMQAAQKLAQIEEMRRAQKPPSLPSKPVSVPSPPRLGKTNSSAELSRSSGSLTAPTRSSAGVVAAASVAASPPKSDFERQFDAIAVSAPTGFRHLRSAAEILKEFDPDFASKQKRPAAIPIVRIL
jgi:small GTP-binding protein